MSVGCRIGTRRPSGSGATACAGAAKTISAIGGLREERSRAKREPFTRADVAALIKLAEGDWRGLIILAATTGLRLMDGARLEWRTLDLDARLICTKTAKTGATLTLPIHPMFATWLAKQPRGIGSARVFPSLACRGETSLHLL